MAKTENNVKKIKPNARTRCTKPHPLSWWRSKALMLAQRLAKERESFPASYGGGYVGDRACRCISCGKVIPMSEAEGGHYVTRQCRATEIDADNIHPQCHRCNCFLGGNVVNYRYQLANRIGESRVKRLEAMYQAWKGSQEAMASLSENDQIEAIRIKGVPYYRQRCLELEDAIKKEESRW